MNLRFMVFCFTCTVSVETTRLVLAANGGLSRAGNLDGQALLNGLAYLANQNRSVSCAWAL